MKIRLKRIGISFLIFIFFLFIMELVLSWVYTFPNSYYTYTPNSRFIWPIDKNYIEGITKDTATVDFNSFGSRSSEIPANCKNQIITIGGSTVACFALDQNKNWTYLLQKKLGEDYWVGNFGRLGNNTNHHIYQTENLLRHDELKNVYTIIFLIGFNDFGGSLANENKHLNQKPLATQLAAFAHLPDSVLPFHRQTTTFKLLKKIKNSWSNSGSDKSYGSPQNKMRMQRLKSALTPTLPDLSKGKLKYKENIKTLIDICQRKNIRPIFVTQPTMWKANLEPKYDSLLLHGYRFNSASPDKLTYYTTDALAQGMNSFNQLLIDLCKEEKVDCLDLSSKMPKSTKSFYDDCHFNESGAEFVANEVARFIQEID